MAVDKATERYLYLYSKMAPAERLTAGVVAPSSLIGLSKEQVQLALAKLENYEATAKIKGSLKERSDELKEQAEKSEQRWENAQKKYYMSLNNIPLNKYDENYAKMKKISDDCFFELGLAADHMLGDKKRANNASIWS